MEMDLKQLLAGIAEVDPSINAKVKGLENDSRRVSTGDAFIAYKGFAADGRDYIKDVINQGIVAVIYEAIGKDLSQQFQTDIPFIAIPNLKHEVGKIAARFYHDPSKSMTIIAITGTNGKTSCAQFIAQALGMLNIRCGILGTLGNGFLPNLKKTSLTTLCPIQLQKTLAKLKSQNAKAVVLEASSHALHQGRLEALHIDIAVLTHLSRDHLDYHGDMESYAKAKELLFQHDGLKHAVINLDDEFGQNIIKKYFRNLDIVGYSTTNHRDSRIRTVLAKNIGVETDGFHVEVQTPWGEGEFNTKLLGTFNINNILAVLSVLCLIGISLNDALKSLTELKTVKGRMETFGNKNQPLVIVDYAHSPDSLEKALSELKKHCRGKLFCVFGCGGDRDKGKRPMMSATAERYADYIIMTNDNPRTESPDQIIQDMQKGLLNSKATTVELDRSAAIHYAVQQAGIGDVVLIAGKGHETTQTINDQVLPFDDTDEVKQALKAYGQQRKL